MQQHPRSMLVQDRNLASDARNFVKAEPEPTGAIIVRREPPAAPGWLTTAAPGSSPTFSSAEGAREITSPMERAMALRVRLLPFAGAWAVISIVLGGLVLLIAQSAPGAAIVALLSFGAMTAITYYKMDRQEYEHSREGTERHKVDTVYSIRVAELDHDLAVKKMALDAYVKMLGGEVDHG